MTEVPSEVSNDEQLNRRIHPSFVKSDGSFSSQAFTDIEMSVDRANYRSVSDSLMNYKGYGLAGFLAAFARGLGQIVKEQPELLNPAHAIVEGRKSKSIARQLAKSSKWVVNIYHQGA